MVGEHAPDIVLIQETKQSDEKFPFSPWPRSVMNPPLRQGQWNGVAIFSRWDRGRTRGFGDDDPEARFIGATCGRMRVYSCYVPNGRALDDPHYAYKLEWLANWPSVLANATGLSRWSSAATSTSRRLISMLRPESVRGHDSHQ